jgi:L-rhamnose mutarotase
MERVAFKMKLLRGFEDEYKKRHDDLWPDLKALLMESGISEYSIFLDPANLELTGVLRVEDADTLKRLPQHPVMKRWWAYMQDIMETNADHSPVSIPLKEVFYLR